MSPFPSFCYLSRILNKLLTRIVNRDTSLTDPWARMISYHFLNQTSRENFFTNDTGHGAGQLWSDIPQIPSFQAHKMPFPIIMANSRPVGSNLTTRLAPEPIVYEVGTQCLRLHGGCEMLTVCSLGIAVRVRLMGPQSWRDAEPNVRGHAPDERPAREQHLVCHRVRPGGVHHGHERVFVQRKSFFFSFAP